MEFIDKIYEYYRILFDKLVGTDFIESSIQKDIKDLTHINIGSHSYSWHLKNVFKKLIINNDSIIDIGSSKGAAMFLMSQYKFKRIDGIELSTKLSTIAKQNFKKLNLSELRIYNLDARDFDDYKNYNIYYMYNPFSEFILEKVIEKISDCNPKNLEKLIIYNNPKYPFILKKYKFYLKLDMPGRWGNRIHIYSNYKKSYRLDYL